MDRKSKGTKAAKIQFVNLAVMVCELGIREEFE
jgi:hypothetical protein